MSTLSAATLAVCAVVLTTATFLREAPAQSTGGPRQGTEVANAEGYAAEGSRIESAGPGPVLVEFSDFQCPACRTLSASLADLRREGRRFVVVYRHYPIRAAHPHATAAAIAAECAGAQRRFEAYHDLLFAVQDSIGAIPWRALATRAGVADLETFDRCLGEPHAAARVEADMAAAERLGVDGTPTLIVAGRKFTGAPPRRVLDSLLRVAAADR